MPKYYSERQKLATIKYLKNSTKRIPLDVPIEFYEEVLKPLADRQGVAVNKMIKDVLQQYVDENDPDAACRIYKTEDKR